MMLVILNTEGCHPRAKLGDPGISHGKKTGSPPSLRSAEDDRPLKAWIPSHFVAEDDKYGVKPGSPATLWLGMTLWENALHSSIMLLPWVFFKIHWSINDSL